MTDEQIAAVREVRAEADRLRLACIVAAKTQALLHVAFDPNIEFGIPLDEQTILGRIQ